MEFPHDVISADQFPPKILDWIFKAADRIIYLEKNDLAYLSTILLGKIVGEIFEEPSTRTFLSFGSAVGKTGATVLTIQHAGVFSSEVKGEIVEDTSRASSDVKLDVIVMRRSVAGSAYRAAAVLEKFGADTHIINAGDGNHEHPTQMMLDMYTVRRKKRKEYEASTLTAAIVGDLRDSRVLHSDVKSFIQRGIKKLIAISEKRNDLPEEILAQLAEKNIEYVKTSDILKYAAEVDVWIFTRLQLERKRILGKILKMVPRLKRFVQKRYNKRFGMTKELQAKIKKDAIVMHPLPRAGEIPTWMDEDPRAVYLSAGKDAESQVTNGLYIRMALLVLLLAPSLFRDGT